jgi:vacuolar-type H+-ATPase catalytic subunit A/Vma1
MSASSGPPATGKPALPEIQARFSEKSAMVRIHCGSGKGVAVTVLAEVEDLGLSIVHANVMPFSACTVIITITAKASLFSFLNFLH